YSDRGLLTGTVRHTGQVTSISWDGDRKMSETDENGIVTTYTYDPLGRVQTSTRTGVPASDPYPAQSNIVTTYTYDADGRELTQTTTGGGLSLSHAWSYALAGRLLPETDEAGLLTTYDYTSGGRTLTVTLPGGATRITDRFLDGRPKSETGTAVVARYFD